MGERTLPGRLAGVVVVALMLAITASALAGANSASGTGDLRWSAPVVMDRAAPAGSGYAIPGVSCPARNLCLAVDERGELLLTSNPAGGEAAWRISSLIQRALTAVDCPSRQLCVLGDANHDLLTSTNPWARRPAWRILHL